MTDAEILAVINPPAADRDRSSLVTHRIMPPLANWRNATPIGAVLDMKTHSVISNHYRVICSRLPPRIYHYHVHMYRLMRDGTMDAEDCTPKEDTRNLISILLELRKRHPEWTSIGGKTVGVAYDGKSALFTSARLPFTLYTAENQAYYEERVFMINADGSASSKGYLVSHGMINNQRLISSVGETHSDCRHRCSSWCS